MAVTPCDAGDAVVCGRQPVLAALRSGRPLRRLTVARGSRGPAIDEILALARSREVPCDLRPRQDLDRLAGVRARHQGVVALAAARPYASYPELLARGGGCTLLVFLDGIQDPHNLGAIIRSAHALGADGVVVPERGAAGLTAAAARAAAGAAEFLPLCQVGNLVQALARARAAGLWLTALVPDADRAFTEVDYRGAVGLVVGGEGRGVRRLVREACDHQVGIPMACGEVGSFNASVAAALALYEVFRQRREPPPGSRSDA